MTGRQVVGVLILASPLVAITVYAILQGKGRDVLFFWGTAVVVAPGRAEGLWSSRGIPLVRAVFGEFALTSGDPPSRSF